jgi:hypothetical protein
VLEATTRQIHKAQYKDADDNEDDVHVEAIVHDDIHREFLAMTDNYIEIYLFTLEKYSVYDDSFQKNILVQ